MEGPQLTIQIKCTLGWQLVREYDNADNHSAIECDVVITDSKSIKGSVYTGTVNEKTREEAENAGVKVTWAAVSAKVGSGYQASKILRDYVSSTIEVWASEQDISESTTETIKLIISPRQKLYLYQQTFSGPGIFFTTDVTSTTTSHMRTPANDQEVVIEVASCPVQCISAIDISRQNNAQDNQNWERDGKSEDPNQGKDEKYDWIVPQHTNIATIHDSQPTVAKNFTQLALYRNSAARWLLDIRNMLGSPQTWLEATYDTNDDGPTFWWLL